MKKPKSKKAAAQKPWLRPEVLSQPLDVETPSVTPQPQSPRLLDKTEVLAITGASFPTLWTWMRAKRFPRARICGGKSKWLSTEVEQWVANLPIRKLKGDAE